jgi:hypothetical protein
MSRTLICTISAALLTLVAGGCASQQAAPTASMGDLGNAPAVISLGAGDSLGHAVYVNDLILAAAALDKSTTFTNVDAGATELLVDH